MARSKKVVYSQVGIYPAFPWTLNIGYSDGSCAIVKIGKKACEQLIKSGYPAEG